jgi:hypothetical protein
MGFTSLTLNPATYTLHLLAQLAEMNVKIYRHRVSSIYEAFCPILPSSPEANIHSDLVINATGLGSLSLLGISDPLVHPAKGQTITVRAPQIKECLGDWSTHVNPQVAERIWREAQELCPELKEEGVEIISHNVGLRPCRKGGIRIEAEEIDLSKAGKGVVPGQSMVTGKEGRKGVCIHAYGIGGAG